MAVEGILRFSLAESPVAPAAARRVDEIPGEESILVALPRDGVEHLLAEAQAGDAGAVNRLLDRHRDAVRRMIDLRMDRVLKAVRAKS